MPRTCTRRARCASRSTAAIRRCPRSCRSSTAATVNFFGPNTPAVEQRIIATEFRGDAYKITSTIDGVQGKASRELVSLAGRPAGAGARHGVSGREVPLRSALRRFKPATSRATAATSSSPIASARSAPRSREINIPIFKGLETNFAVRWDKYQGRRQLHDAQAGRALAAGASSAVPRIGWARASARRACRTCTSRSPPA